MFTQESSKQEIKLSDCCDSQMRNYIHTKKLNIMKCAKCGSLFVQHSKEITSNPWDDSVITNDFLKALELRRSRQALKIISSFSILFKENTLLDYGCGQGIFTKMARDKGINCVGCDLFLSKDKKINDTSFFKLTAQWQIPANSHLFSAIIMLDIIEHHKKPMEFIADWNRYNISYLIIKTPLIDGPIAMIALVCARFGFPDLLERLLLAGQSLPHQCYLSKKGLVRLAQKAGYKKIDERMLADVGKELPERIGISNKLLSKCLSLAGLFIEFLSIFWSDTAVIVFQKDDM